MPNTLQDKPLAGDLLSNSQADIRGNFGYLPGALGKDHQVVFGDSDTGTQFEGRHLQVSFKNRGGVVANPGDGTSSFLYDNGGDLFWRNATVGPVQMTNATVPLNATTGYTFLPGGILLQWGSVAGAAVPQVINYTIAFTTVYQTMVTLSNSNRTYGVSANGNNSFTVAADASLVGYTVFWYAIGAK